MQFHSMYLLTIILCMASILSLVNSATTRGAPDNVTVTMATDPPTVAPDNNFIETLINGLLSSLDGGNTGGDAGTALSDLLLQLLTGITLPGNATDTNGTTDGVTALLQDALLSLLPEDVANLLNLGTDGNDLVTNLLGQVLGPLLNGGNVGNGTGLDMDVVVQLAATAVNLALQSRGVGEECRDDLFLIVQGILNQEDWATSVLDAMGKPGSEIKEGNFKMLGSYDQCHRIDTPVFNEITDKQDHFTGKYCRINVQLDSGPYASYGIGTVMYGACVSTKCSAGDIDILLTEAQKLLLNGTVMFDPEVTCMDEESLGTDAILCLCFLAMLFALVIFGTLYDVLAVQMTGNQNGKSKTENRNTVYKSEWKATNLKDDNPAKVMGYEPSHSLNGLPKPYTNGGYVYNEGEGDTTKDIATPKQVVLLPDNQGKGFAAAADEKPEVALQTKRPDRGTIEQVLLAFSAYTNGVKILNTGQAAGTLGAVNGIRFLSMAWVILGHTIYFSLGHYEANGLPYFVRSLDNWTFVALSNATLSVDSFFALSGVLVAYLTLKELRKIGGATKLNWFMFYFHRFWRLTPPYMLVLMVGTVFVPYFIDGPMKAEGEVPFMENCRTSWWTNLLYINNYVATDKSCMGWTWYLSNDMQFYIISPIILLPLFYNVFAGVLSCLIFLAASTIAVGIIAYKHAYPAQIFSPYAPPANDSNYDINLYLPSYARMGPYIVGLFTGYVLYRTKCKIRMPKVVNVLLWLLSISLCTVIIYSLYSEGSSHILTRQESAAYIALHRTGWSIAVCWMIFACATGYGGWIDELLSWRGFIPLGRLTYSAYLIHPLMMIVFYASRRAGTYFTNYELIYLFLGHMCMSYGVGFVVSLLFESPMMGLEKAIFKRGRK